MKKVFVITHPDVVIDPMVDITEWSLSPRGKARMKKLLAQPWVEDVRSVYCSAERKARDGAEILAEFLSLEYEVIKELGEIDRSSTGYLPREEHEAAARKLFEYPEQSNRGWETARDGQERMARAIETLVSKDQGEGDIAIVSHGGVATLYLCRLKDRPISIEEAPPGANGGYYYCFDTESKSLLHGWKRIDLS